MMDSSENFDSPEALCKQLLRNARTLLESNKLSECLDNLNTAYLIKPCEKIARKISRLKQYQQQTANVITTSEVNGNSSIPPHHRFICEGFSLHKKIVDKLYQHQVEGITWLYSLFKNKKGGILGKLSISNLDW